MGKQNCYRCSPHQQLDITWPPSADTSSSHLKPTWFERAESQTLPHWINYSVTNKEHRFPLHFRTSNTLLIYHKVMIRPIIHYYIYHFILAIKILPQYRNWSFKKHTLIIIMILCTRFRLN